ncbi:MAG: XdhC/CoxI family protein [Proteobacteria bacterium]|nr:XdhC/CoxI family protein [Pseudomonadota bacterium]
MDLYGIIEQYIKNGQKGILASIIYRAGSAPRDVGAKMFVGEDGKAFGTVGGGRLEADAYKEALGMMKKTETKILHIRMDARTIEEEGMLCGGNVDILLEPILKRYSEVYEGIRLLEKKGKRGIVVTRFGQNIFSKTLIRQDLEIIGDPLDRETVERLKDYLYEKKPVVVDGEVVEAIQVSSPLYIFGAGHVSQFLSKIAKIVDFHVTVIDDREEFANRERFPEADEVIVEDFTKVFNRLDFTGDEYIAILTRGHRYDAEVLEESLRKPVKYIGMIGSKRKVKMVYGHLRECGFDEKTLDGVHAPIGIHINAETPQEIAISIVAELIKVRGEQQDVG